MIQLYPFQKEGVRLFHQTNGRVLLSDEMGLGKAQPLDAKILTPTGWRLMGELRVGEEVIGSQGGPVRIAGVFPQGKKEVFRSVLSDGATVECCDDHLWSVNSPLRIHRGVPFRTLSFREIRISLTHASGNRQHFLPLVKPVQYAKGDELPIAPYLMGCLLAEGGLTVPSAVKVSVSEIETLTHLKTLLPEGQILNHTGGVEYSIVRLEDRSWYGNHVLNVVRWLGLSGKEASTKFIPESYLRSSIEDRMELLRGLMDGDGWICNGVVGYCTVSKQLAQDVIELIQSLGGVVRTSLKNPTFSYKGEKRYGKLAYSLCLALPDWVQPFRLARKADQHKPREKYQPSRSFASVECVGMKECQCIEVDSPDGLYVTNDYTLTHNTIQFYQYISENPARPVVVVCPASLKYQWQEEGIQKFGIKSLILGTKTPYSLRGDDGVYIINYEILPKWLAYLRGIRPKIIAGDEVHRISNYQTKTYKSFNWLCNGPEDDSYKVPHVFGISGTPLTNRPWDLFPILNILWPQTFDSAWAFGMEFCDCEGKDYGKWKFKGAKNLQRLHSLLVQLGMVRRTFEEVMPQLPPLIYHTIPVEIENPKEYDEAEDDVVAWLRKYNPLAADRAARAERWTRFGYLKRLAANLSIKNKMDWLGDFLDSSGKDKILVGAIHRGVDTPIMPRIMERFAFTALQIHGAVPLEERKRVENQFKTDPSIRMLLGQVRAAGEGLNLPEANNVALVEQPFTPGAAKQFIKRAHRVTSTRPVNAYFLCAKGTIEEKLLEILQRKARILDKVLDGQVDVTSMNVFDELQKALTQEKA